MAHGDSPYDNPEILEEIKKHKRPALKGPMDTQCDQQVGCRRATRCVLVNYIQRWSYNADRLRKHGSFTAKCSHSPSKVVTITMSDVGKQCESIW